MLFFFYGTLMDRELRRKLLGARAAQTLRVTPGVLIHHRRFAARYGDYPVLVPELNGRVSGVFVEGMDARALLWIAHFEGPWYLPERVTAFDECRRHLRPWAFRPTHRGAATNQPWDFRRWQRTGKPQVREMLNTWLLSRNDGVPIALDTPWLARRRLRDVVRQAAEQPRPNPHLERRAIAEAGLDEGDDRMTTAAA